MRALLVAEGCAEDYVHAVSPLTLEPVEQATPDTIVAVAARLGATRLIDNAVLHGKSAPLVKVAGGPQSIELRVIDDGPGISEANKTRIFGNINTRDDSSKL